MLPPSIVSAGKDSAPAKRKAPAAGIAGRKRAKGGIYLSDSDDEMPQPRIIEDETAAGEEEEEGAREQEGKNEVEEKAPTKADDFFASMKQDSKPKSKADDFLAQMMSGKVEKKAPSAMVGGPGGALAGIMSGLVSARPSSGAGGSSLAKSSSISKWVHMHISEMLPVPFLPTPSQMMKYTGGCGTNADHFVYSSFRYKSLPSTMLVLRNSIL
jgi:hypothetical protein